MILIFYLTNLSFGLMIIMPLWMSLNSFAGFSLMAQKLAGRFDMNFLFEFLKYNDGTVSAIQGIVLIVFPLYWLSSLFLSGGAFTVFATSGKFESNLFWRGAIQHFGRFLRLLIYGVPVVVVLLSVPMLVRFLRDLIFGRDPYQYIAWWADWIQFGMLYIAILVFGLIFDYARIHAVLSGEKQMRFSIWRGIQFSFRNFHPTLGLSLILFLTGALLLLIYNLLADWLFSSHVLVVILLFALQQFYMFLRMVLKLALFSGQINLYKNIVFQNQRMDLAAKANPAIDAA
jgi:hypothetical protein